MYSKFLSLLDATGTKLQTGKMKIRLHDLHFIDVEAENMKEFLTIRPKYPFGCVNESEYLQYQVLP